MGCVLDRLGADTFGSLHLNTDGMFPNHIPNPEDKTAMALNKFHNFLQNIVKNYNMSLITS